jgi:hypothetical protein
MSSDSTGLPFKPIPDEMLADLPAALAGLERKPQRRRHSRTAWRERPEIWYVVTGLGLLVLAGGGTPVWARALVLILAGAWLWRRPPTETPSRVFDVAILVLVVVVVVTAFGPAAWYGRVDWRLDAADFGVKLPWTNAPSPWLAAEAVAELLAGLGWLYAWWSLRLDHESRKWSLWGVAGVASVLALGLAVGRAFNVKYPLAQEAMYFSYFPNKNQTALWFCVGGVIACGMLLENMPHRRRRLAAMIAGGMLMACMVGVVLARSRMGLILLAVGCVVVLAIRLGTEMTNYAVRILLPLGILALSLVVIFERDTLERFHVINGSDEGKEFRVELWLDTLGMANAQPAGVGLGQFEDVYPQYRERAKTYQAVYHPDSDWVWLLGETGWAGVTAAAVAVGALLTVFFGRVGRGSGPYRHLAGVCAGLFLLHSFVDVPSHRFGTWLLAAWLLGLAAPERGPMPGLIPKWVFRLLGAGLVVVGIIWLGAVAGLSTETTLIEDRAMANAETAIANGDAAGAAAATQAVMAVRPMRWWPYYERARAELTLNEDQKSALDDFRRARLLEPNWSGLPIKEGYLWAAYDPALAYAAWREAMQRNDNVPMGTWLALGEALRALPNGEDYYSNLSKTRPEYRRQYLLSCAPERFPAEWADEMSVDPLLKRYSPTDRQALLERWAELDGAGALAYVQEHPHIAPQEWVVELRALGQAGRYQDALDLAHKRLTAAAVPTFPGSNQYDDTGDKALMAAFQNEPQDLVLGTLWFKRQMDEKDAAGAFATLQMLEELKPAPPPFVSWWLAELLEQQGKPADAWVALQPYLEYERRLLLEPAQATPAPQTVIGDAPLLKPPVGH